MGLLESIKSRLWDPPAPPAFTDKRVLEAKLAEAKRRRDETFSHREKVDSLTAKLRAEDRKNHFGEAVSAAMRKRHA